MKWATRAIFLAEEELFLFGPHPNQHWDLTRGKQATR
jgi:hypothetical protein